MQNRNRTEKILIAVSEEEKRLYFALAKKLNTKLSDLIRTILDRRVKRGKLC
jgi:hypothetical protein